MAYISRLEIGNVVLRPARLEVGHYDIRAETMWGAVCSCGTIVGGSPLGILDLMRGRGRKSLGVVDGTS